jgi:hypothetical protein
LTTPSADIFGKPFTKRQSVLLELLMRKDWATFEELSAADMALGPKVQARSYKTDSETLARRVGGTARRDPPRTKPKNLRRFGITVP